MTLRRHIGARAALAAACVLSFALLAWAPTAAFAQDTVYWTDAYHGPADIPVYLADPTPVAGTANSVAFADATHGWMVGARVDGVGPMGGGVKTAWYAFTSDGGSTWTSASIPASPALGVEMLAVAAPASTTVIAAGEAGRLARFDGVSWTATQVAGWPATATVRGVAFADATHGWAVGDGGGILSTADGGLTWSIDSAPNTGRPAWNAVAVADATHVWAVGGGGAMALWDGATWSPRASGTASTLRTIAFADAAHGRAAGDSSTFVATSDGSSWAAESVPLAPAGATASVRGVSFSPTGTCIAVGTGMSVWRTTDGGAIWLAGGPDGITNLFGNGTISGLTLTALTFVPGSGALPVAVGRLGTIPTDQANSKAWAFKASTWTRLAPLNPPQFPSASQPGTTAASALVWYLNAHADELGFTIERSRAGGPYEAVATQTIPAGLTYPHQFTFADAPLSAETSYTYRVRSYNSVGYSPPAQFGLTVRDLVAPVTTATVGGAPVTSAWRRDAATVTLTVSDPVTSSPTVTHYVLDSAAGVYAGPFAVSGDGVHTLDYRTVDGGGNTETTHVATIRIDSTPPSTAANVPATLTAGSQVTLTPVDGVSGVASTRWSLDGGPAVPGVVASFPTTGTHVLTWSSVDVAGNREATVAAVVDVLDAPPVPVTALSANGATLPASPGWFTARTVVTLTPSIPASTFVGIDGAAMTASSSVLVSREGTTTLRYYALTPAGGREATRTCYLRLDSRPPTTTAPGVRYAYIDAATIALSAADAVSGVASTRWSIDGGPATSGKVVTCARAGLHALAFSSADAAGNREPTRTVTFNVYRTTTVGIAAASTTSHIGLMSRLYGRVTPADAAGRTVLVYVMRPGSTRWVQCGAPVVTVVSGKAWWKCGYLFRAGSPTGVYRFKARFPAQGGFLGSTSTTLTVLAR